MPDGTKLGRAKLRGVVSEGMILAEDELEIGAGGGSIAWIDSGGILRVGPRSAGAVPGPVCYGKGATEPTVTPMFGMNVSRKKMTAISACWLTSGRRP